MIELSRRTVTATAPAIVAYRSCVTLALVGALASTLPYAIADGGPGRPATVADWTTVADTAPAPGPAYVPVGDPHRVPAYGSGSGRGSGGTGAAPAGRTAPGSHHASVRGGGLGSGPGPAFGEGAGPRRQPVGP
ncbi:hypothetical protein ABZ714_20570 [Streptomyces sp. NPDC006798]|uniref:hypothetical protein n=1 Tax=Streptomyces sp. NPDC006798 TaxID=3155462 RepID=UPI0033E53A6B